ncbi:hypothetical protein MRX96_010563 [Rhipicephalus microplus]
MVRRSRRPFSSPPETYARTTCASLSGQGYAGELVPPTACHEGDVKSEHERERYVFERPVAVQSELLEQLPLVGGQEAPVADGDGGERGPVHQHLLVDELVDRAAPAGNQLPESQQCARGHVGLVRDRHDTACVKRCPFKEGV